MTILIGPVFIVNCSVVDLAEGYFMPSSICLVCSITRCLQGELEWGIVEGVIHGVRVRFTR